MVGLQVIFSLFYIFQIFYHEREFTFIIRNDFYVIFKKCYCVSTLGQENQHLLNACCCMLSILSFLSHLTHEITMWNTYYLCFMNEEMVLSKIR